MKIFALLTYVALGYGLHVLDNPGNTMTREIETENGPVTLIVGKPRGRSVKFDVPKPFEVKSGLVSISEDKSSRTGRKISPERDADGIPIIEGIRVPDDDSDTLTYRNARIINNVLVPYEKDLLSGKADIPIEDDNEISTSRRQARILTGDDDEEEEQFESTKIEKVQSSARSKPSPVYYSFYDPARVGLITPDEVHQAKEKIVTYSYNTAAGGGIKRSDSKDVVYGQGEGAAPPTNEEISAKNNGPIRTYSAYSNPQRPVLRPQRQVPQQPTPQASSQVQVVQKPETGFLPSHFPYAPQTQNSQRRVSEQPQSNSGFKFPEEPKSLETVVPVYQPQGSSQQSYYQDRNGQSSHFQAHAPSQQQFQTQSQTQYSQVPHQPENHLQQAHHRPHDNQPQYPTPQQVLGSQNPIISNSQVIPVDPNNFVIENASFQTHPGAPIFNIPVPKPANQVDQGRFQSQYQNQYNEQDTRRQQPQYPYQYDQQAPVFGQQPEYQYQYIVEDNRPLIEKMLDPIRRAGHRFRQMASPVINPVLNAGNRIGDRFRLPERIDKIASGNLGADAIPVFAGAAAVATLGALGAYAASRFNGFNSDFLTLPNAGKRSQSESSISEVLLKLAQGLEDEEPSIVRKLTTDASWLESRCARKIFCSLVTDSMDEEEKKMPSGRSNTSFERDVLHLEKQMNVLIERDGSTGERNAQLKKAAEEVLNGVRQRDCRALTCSQKKE